MRALVRAEAPAEGGQPVQGGGQWVAGAEELRVAPEALLRSVLGRRATTATGSARRWGHSYRSTIASMSGNFMLPLSADNRAGARITAGAEVEVLLKLDTDPREVAVPDDLRMVRAPDPAARTIFDGRT